jgi:hypothetical protein
METLDAGGVWSIDRGLARNEGTYKNKLMACDVERRNDLDGRGHLSEEALADFTNFFLSICIDQVDFMERLVQPDRLRDRILIWAEEEIRANTLPPKTGAVLEAVLYRCELPRGDVALLLGTSERNARRVTSALLERGVLVSASTRAPLRLAFPAKLAPRWMPGLFPEPSRERSKSLGVIGVTQEPPPDWGQLNFEVEGRQRGAFDSVSLPRAQTPPTAATGSQLIAGPARWTGARARFGPGPWSPLPCRFKSQADTRALMTNAVLVKRA